MSNKSGTDIISIPKGGGALKGIGEKFSPDLHTGTGNYSVPIDLPPGRNGFQPSLSLVYSTGNGNSPFGLGWAMSIPGVTRKTDKGVPLFDDGKDVFILSGNEDLVPVEIKSDATRYQPRTEGSFARITHIKRPVDNIDYWDVRSKDGMVSIYGTPDPKSTEEFAAIAKPERGEGVAEAEGRSHIYAWKLTETRDPFGNRIVFSYMRDAQQEDGPHRWDQIYLSEIRYVDYGDPGNLDFLISVRFYYEERPDPFSEHRPGFEIRTTKRCKKIEIRTHHSDNPTPIKTYYLIYQDEDVMPTAMPPHNGMSLLTRIQVGGQRQGEPQEFMPPLDFKYGMFEPEKRNFESVAGKELPPESLGHPQNELADLFGNGLPDIIKMNGGQVRYWRNLGNGRFDLPRTMRKSPGGLNLADPDVQLIDADGDGRIDLMVTRPGLTGFYPLSFDGEWDKRSFQKYDFTPSFNLKDPEVKLIDLDGDGVTDALRSGSSFECYFNRPKRGWYDSRRVPRRRIHDFPDINFSDPRVKWADMTGDGLTDIVLVHDGRVDYWPALGRGEFAPRVTMQNNPRFPYGYDPKRILIGDVDGDGVADMIYVDNQKVTLWMNQGGNRWSEPIEIQGSPSVTDMDAVRLVDLLGTGVPGVLWSQNANLLSRDSMFFLDFTGGHKPYLLERIDNNMGSVTNIGYASSTRYYLQDRSKGFDWKTPLPFPVQVVSKVESIDEISGGKLTTEYSYHHGYWDGAEREFRGFGRVDQRDTEVFDDYHSQGMDPEDRAFESVELRHFSSPTETRTWFHQGPVGLEYGDWREIDYTDEYWEGDTPALMRNEETEDLLRAPPRRAARDAIRTLRGRILRTELFALDGSEREDKPYTVTENSYGIKETEAPAVDSERARIFFPFETAKRTTQWERGNKPMTQLSFTGDYDEYGQPRLQLSVAVPKGRDWRSHLGTTASEIYLSTRTVTRYAVPNDPELVYIVDRVAHSTVHQIKDDKHVSAFEFWQSVLESGNDIIPPISIMPEIVSQTLNYYDGTAFNGAALGRVITHGALMCSKQLILTEDIINTACAEGRPPYLTEGVTVWTNDYPAEFRSLIEKAGYHYYAADTPLIGGFYTKTAQNKYNNRGLIIGQRDPLGNLTEIEPDQYSLFPGIVTPPNQKLLTQVSYDYQAMKPKEITDPNDNTTKLDYTPLGLLKTIHLSADKVRPSTLFSYDFNAFQEQGQPVYAHATRFVHFGANGLAADLLSEAIETREYSDGFGRLLQTRTQGEEVIFGDEKFGGKLLDSQQDPRASNTVITGRKRTGAEPNVVVSGWQIYDNKGRAVEKYEPFFSTGWTFARPVAEERGQKAILEYDAIGRVFRTTNPDGSQQLTVYGKPKDLAQPDNFEPTPWENYAYDANDNAEKTIDSPNAANTPASHYNTPTSVIVDALGRTVEQVERNGPDSLNDWYHTKTSYDIRGNVLTIHDALERLAFKYTYDLVNQQLRNNQLDGGVCRTVFDAAANPIEYRDSKGALVLRKYDEMNQLTHLWAWDKQGETLTLRERVVYDGVGSGLGDPKTDNLLGQPYKHFDEAGLLTFEKYDFKGNLLEKVRRVISDAPIEAVFAAPGAAGQIQAFRVNWEPAVGTDFDTHANSFLEIKDYRTTQQYDALDRIIELTYPQDVDRQRRVLKLTYNSAGALESVKLDNTDYVKHIAYDAIGQRTIVVYGNDLLTRYAYDEQTFRLARMRTEKYMRLGAYKFRINEKPQQEYGYDYDLAGNIVAIRDLVEGSGAGLTPDELRRQFTYDPLYRLRSATGRERDLPMALTLWEDTGRPHWHDNNKTRAYEEIYSYDRVGNFERLEHKWNGHKFVRNFELIPDTNRLKKLALGNGLTTSYDYEYDDNGNIVRETTSRHFEWDNTDRIRVFKTQPVGGAPSVYAHYLYDSGGQRVKKYVRKNGKTEMTVYVDGIFEYQKVTGVNPRENNILHIMDGEKRIATRRIGPAFNGDLTPMVKYIFGDHLGSSSLVMNSNGGLINREEYTPYGETSFGSYAFKRYRFTGKERDEESGLYYHGARYYASWLGRWVSCDPAGIVDGINLYEYSKNSPIGVIDPTGLASLGFGELVEEVPGGTARTQVGIKTSEGLGHGLPVTKIKFDLGKQHAIEGSAQPKATESPEPKGAPIIVGPAETPLAPGLKGPRRSHAPNLFPTLSPEVTGSPPKTTEPPGYVDPDLPSATPKHPILEKLKGEGEQESTDITHRKEAREKEKRRRGGTTKRPGTVETPMIPLHLIYEKYTEEKPEMSVPKPSSIRRDLRSTVQTVRKRIPSFP